MKNTNAKPLWKKAAIVTSLILTTIAVQSCGKPESQDFNFNDVGGLGRANPYPNFRGGDVKGEKNFAYLINHYAKAAPKKPSWAGYWWPYTEGGISSGKWGGGLSPAGKYDAARGHQTDAQSWEARFHGPGVKGVQSWWGHCNGWCASSALYPEPHEPVTVNGITFGVADIKGLLAEAGMSADADFFGNRVDWPSDYNTPKADDTVPDQYFLVLTNYMGKQGYDVLIDRYTGDQVWNQPLAGYQIDYPTPQDYLGADPDHPGVYRINVSSTIWWYEDGVSADVQTPPFDFPAYDTGTVSRRDLKMEVWLDGPVVFGPDGKIKSSGNVIVTRQGQYFVGGAWKMGGFFNQAWPDYMWVPYRLVPPSDPNDDSANPQIDIRWIEQHILVPGGRDDPSAHPGHIDPAPSLTPSPTPSSHPTPHPSNTDNPEPDPTPTHTSGWHFPWPWDTSTPTPEPTLTSTPIPTHVPTSEPTFVPTSVPTFGHGSHHGSHGSHGGFGDGGNGDG